MTAGQDIERPWTCVCGARLSDGEVIERGGDLAHVIAGVMPESCGPVFSTVEPDLSHCDYYRNSGSCSGGAGCEVIGEPCCFTDEPRAKWPARRKADDLAGRSDRERQQ